MLYLILPYFNFHESIFSKKNLDLFISNYSNFANLKIIISEGIYNEELPDYSNKIYKHLKFKLSNVLWIKENLINIAIRSLPEDAEFIAWADRDIFFLNPYWVEESINELKTKDIIQPWSEVIHLNEKYELETIKRKDYFNFSSKGIIAKFLKNDKLSGSSTGQIWAINKKFYKKIGKINDIEIVGGADSILANFCIIKNASYIKRMNIRETQACVQNWNKYKENFNNFSYGYINGTIVHYWHGNIEDRQYVERHRVLTNQNYNPDNDIEYDDHGVLRFTEHGKRLEPFIKGYFLSRRENENMPLESTNNIFSTKYFFEKCLIPKYKKIKE